MRKKLITAVLMCLILVLTLGVTAIAADDTEPPAEGTTVAEEVVDTNQGTPVEESIDEAIEDEIVISEQEVTVEPKVEGTVETDEADEPVDEDNATEPTDEETAKDGTVAEEAVPEAVTEEVVQAIDDTAANNANTFDASGGSYVIKFIMTTDEGEKACQFYGGSEDGISVKDILTGLDCNISSDSQIDILEDTVDTEVIGLRRTDDGLFIVDFGMFSKASKDLIVTVNGKKIQLSVVDDKEYEYLSPVYADETDVTKGITGWETKKVLIGADRIINNSTTTLTAGWWAVADDVTTGSLTINGAVNLLLLDNAKLTAKGASGNAGIFVSGPGNSLTIYAQSTGENVGELEATGGNEGAGIGGNSGTSGSNITINGGFVMAIGTSSAAGIGGGQCGDGIDITVNGGTVTAGSSGNGAGIGGGSGTTGSNININFGIVFALGSVGIGSGKDGSPSSNIYVKNTVILVAGDDQNHLVAICEYRMDTTDLSSDPAFNKAVVGTTIPNYLSPVYNTKDDPTSGIKEWKKQSIEAIKITNSDEQVTLGKDGETTWYYVVGNVTLSKGAICKGNVNVILVDNAELTATDANNQGGICVSGDGNSLTVYAQSTGDSAGKLIATGSAGGAGIGGGSGVSGSNIIVNGGTVTATGSTGGAGIGGGSGASGSNIIANGGTVTATGSAGGAGIGGGNWGYGSNITINGGTVTATGDSSAAGIGGGDGQNSPSASTVYGSNIIINDGTVKASSKDSGAGIGGGRRGVNGDGSGRNITINGGTVTASSRNQGAGIGGGQCGDGIDITINGGTVEAKNMTGPDTIYSGAGIGGGMLGNGKNITINGGTVTAYTGGNGTVDGNGAGIGGGMRGSGSDITINGGTVTAYSSGNGAGIGSGSKDNEGGKSGTNITINGGVVKAYSKRDGAGIGGGSGTAGSNITINVGTVTAYSSGNGAGIGGGSGASGSNITINGGTVKATGGSSAVGIGSGKDGSSSSNIYVKKALLLKAGQDEVNAVEVCKNREDATDLSNLTEFNQPYVSTPLLYYLSPVYNKADDPKSGIKDWETKYQTAIEVESSDTEVTWGSTGNPTWYYVKGGESVTLSKGVTCVGSVNIILVDGCSLTVKLTNQESLAGITVTGTNSLTIYGQSDGTGKLTANGSPNGAGIGGGSYVAGNNITINGGTVTATCGSYDGAGIGGGYKGAGNNILINGGTVTANGGDSGAGIGGGYQGAGSNIIINGGTVTANGRYGAAGIGGGDQGSGSNITINGGNVSANSNYAHYAGAGIGGGYQRAGSYITINGGKVTAIGGSSPSGEADGIGNGKDSSGSQIINVAKALVVLAGSTEDLKPTDAIQLDRDSTDYIEDDLAGKQYVVVKPGFKVSFDTDSGSTVDPQGVFTGETAVKPDDPTKTDKVFAGWYKADKMSKWNFDTDTITETTIIYAKWGKDSITLTAASDTKVYDGNELTASTFTFTEGILIEGDVLTAIVEGSITNVGMVANKVKEGSIKVTRGSADVTSEYLFDTPVDGTLTVTAKEAALAWTVPSNLVYDKTAKTPTVVVSNLIIGDICEVTASLTSGKDNINVGKFTFTATALGNSNYKMPSTVISEEYEITAKEVTIINTTVLDKTYDGTTDAKVVLGEVIGLINGDTVAVLTAASFDTPEVGENKNVTVTYTLNGEDAGNYKLKSASEVLKASIKDVPSPVPAPSGGATVDDGLIVKEIETNTLTEAQVKAVEKALEEKGITLVNVLNVSKKNADKEHFTATITIEPEYFEGYDPSTLKVWKVNDDNTLTLVPFTVVNGKIIINNGKLGNYIITVG